MNMRSPEKIVLYVCGTCIRKSSVIGLNHGAFEEIQDGRQDGGYFY